MLGRRQAGSQVLFFLAEAWLSALCLCVPKWRWGVCVRVVAVVPWASRLRKEQNLACAFVVEKVGKDVGLAVVG